MRKIKSVILNKETYVLHFWEKVKKNTIKTWVMFLSLSKWDSQKCDSQKSKFIKEQEASLGVKTPLSKISLVVLLLF